MLTQYHSAHRVFMKGKATIVMESLLDDDVSESDEVWVGDDGSIIIGTPAVYHELYAEYTQKGTVGDWCADYDEEDDDEDGTASS